MRAEYRLEDEGENAGKAEIAEIAKIAEGDENGENIENTGNALKVEDANKVENTEAPATQRSSIHVLKEHELSKEEKEAFIGVYLMDELPEGEEDMETLAGPRPTVIVTADKDLIVEVVFEGEKEKEEEEEEERASPWFPSEEERKYLWFPLKMHQPNMYRVLERCLQTMVSMKSGAWLLNILVK
ncbi:MAG: hypothetical protein MMC33_000412 [Icmadophila ericetorum]|nr:hypothetical protein [Icmadophila ericetorum]